jgi:hypothetical protein
MIIETKYNVGQELYFLSKNTGKVECSPVYKMEATIGDVFTDEPKDAKIEVRYFFFIHKKHAEIIKENDCYLTKQELLEAL